MLNLRGRTEALLSEAIRTHPERDRLCAELHGRLLAVRIEGLAGPLNLAVTADGRAVLPVGDVPADVTITGRLPALGAYLLGIEPRSEALRDTVHLSGSAQLAQKYQQLLQGVTLDWEEPLAAALGDLPAHRLANLVRGSAETVRRGADTLLINLLDYLQYESSRVPAAPEWQAFVADLETLQRDLDAIEQRLRTIASHTG